MHTFVNGDVTDFTFTNHLQSFLNTVFAFSCGRSQTHTFVNDDVIDFMLIIHFPLFLALKCGQAKTLSGLVWTENILCVYKT